MAIKLTRENEAFVFSKRQVYNEMFILNNNEKELIPSFICIFLRVRMRVEHPIKS